MSKSPKYQDYIDYVQPTVNGKYEYVGPTFSYGSDNDISYRRYITVMLVCTVLMTILSIWTGTFYVAGMNSIWQFPLGFEILAVCMTTWCVVRLAITKQPMKIFDMRPTAEAVPKRSAFVVISAALGMVLTMTYVFVNGWNGMVLSTIGYIAARLVIALCGGMIYKLGTVNVWDRHDPIPKASDESDEDEAEKPAAEKNTEA